MMPNFKKFVSRRNELFRRFVQPSYGRMAVRDRFEDIRKKIKTESPVIVDGGAHSGTIIDLCLRQYRSPTIHAFEPIPSLVKILKKKYSSNKKVFICENALGAQNTVIPFNILNYPGSSSIMRPSEILKFYHGEKMDIEQTIQVQQVRLDQVLNGEIDLLKLDLQGSELEALKGSEQLIKKIKIITTEIEFVPLYEGQPLFSEIDSFLRLNGFRILNLYDLWTHPDGQLTAGDAIYLNLKYYSKDPTFLGSNLSF